MEKILIVSRENGWVGKLAEVLENHFDSVIIAEPEHAFRVFGREEPDCVLVCDCADPTAMTPEALAYRNVRILVGERAIMRCGDAPGNAEDYIKKPFAVIDLMAKLEVLKGD